MITHLVQQHRVHSQVGATLVDQWRYDSNKKYFSCGFCVAIFPSILERSNHIDNEHWKNGQNMDSWELDILIRGLLLEPKVQAAWRVLLKSYPSLIESNLRWEMPLAKGLQPRLEKSEEPGSVLAKAALDLSTYGRIGLDQEGLKAITDGDEMIFDPHATGLLSPAITTVVCFSSSRCHQFLTTRSRLPHLGRLLSLILEVLARTSKKPGATLPRTHQLVSTTHSSMMTSTAIISYYQDRSKTKTLVTFRRICPLMLSPQIGRPWIQATNLMTTLESKII